MLRAALSRDPAIPLARNPHLLRWVEKMRDLTRPASVHWVDGSDEEYAALCEEMVRKGTATRLNDALWPGCYYVRSDPGDVARVDAARHQAPDEQCRPENRRSHCRAMAPAASCHLGSRGGRA